MERHLRVIRPRPRAIIQPERDENMKQPTRDEILDALASQRSLFERYGVSAVSLFGSLARGEPTEESDIDLFGGIFATYRALEVCRAKAGRNFWPIRGYGDTESSQASAS